MQQIIQRCVVSIGVNKIHKSPNEEHKQMENGFLFMIYFLISIIHALASSSTKMKVIMKNLSACHCIPPYLHEYHHELALIYAKLREYE